MKLLDEVYDIDRPVSAILQSKFVSVVSVVQVTYN